MAGIITIAKGHDASYPWKQIGTAEPGKSAKSAARGVGYYLSPAEKGGEPPGIWTGKAVAELGLRPGCVVDRDRPSSALYGQHLDPRDPSGETRLGRAPGQLPDRRNHLRSDAGRRAGSGRRTPSPADDRGESAGPHT